MIPTLKITLTHARYGTPSTPYAHMTVDGTEVGFITPYGIWLRIWNKDVPEGVYNELQGWKNETYYNKVRYVQRYWNTIYDNYPLVIKGGVEK